MKQTDKFKLKIFYKTNALYSSKISDMNVQKTLSNSSVKTLQLNAMHDSWLDPRLETEQKSKNKTKCYQVQYWDMEKYEYR